MTVINGLHLWTAGYTPKMPMRLVDEDPRFQSLPNWTSADKTIIFCCDRKGRLWETSARLRQLNDLPSIVKAASENRLPVVSPDHKLKAGFLCTDHAITLQTFHRG
jgi:hypothetical protein